MENWPNAAEEVVVTSPELVILFQGSMMQEVEALESLLEGEQPRKESLAPEQRRPIERALVEVTGGTSMDEDRARETEATVIVPPLRQWSGPHPTCQRPAKLARRNLAPMTARPAKIRRRIMGAPTTRIERCKQLHQLGKITAEQFRL